MPGGGALFAQTGTTSLSIPVQLNVSNYPVMFVPSASYSFTSLFGGNTTTPTLYTVVPTTSGTTVFYSVSPSTASWLTINPQPGSPLNTDGGSFTITVNATGLPPGNYATTVTVNPQSNGSNQGSSAIQINLTVTFPNVLQTSIPSNPLVCSGKPCLIFQYQAGQATPASQTVKLFSTTGAPLNYAITPPAATAGWIQVAGPLTGTTDISSFTVSINPSGLPAQPWPAYEDATINIAPTDPNTGAALTPVSIDVKLYLSTTPQLVVSATQPSLTWLPPLQLSTWPNSSKYTGDDQGSITAFLSSTQPVLQELGSVSAQQSVANQASFSDWLWVTNPGFGTPTSFTIGAIRDPNRMPYGTYYGAVSITATAPPNATNVADSPFLIPVQFIVNAAYGSVTWFGSPNPMTFTQTKGGPVPASQVVQVSTDIGSLPFDPVVNTGLSSWLTVSGITGPTPGSFNVSVDATNLPIGTTHGAIYVNIPNASPNPDGTPFRIPVTFNVNGGTICAGSCSNPTTALGFTQIVGGSAPPTQSVPIMSTPSSVTYTMAFTTTTPANGNWLSASITSGGGVTPGVVTASVNPGSLAAGTYTGTLTITSPGATNSPIVIPVTLTVKQATLSAPTTALQFTQLAGGPAPAAQQIAVTSLPSGIPFTVTATSGNNVPWLTATASLPRDHSRHGFRLRELRLAGTGAV